MPTELQCSNPQCQAVYPWEASLVGSYCTACLWGQLLVPLLRHRGHLVRQEDEAGPAPVRPAAAILAARYQRRRLPAALEGCIGQVGVLGPEVLRVGLAGPPSGGKTHLALETVRDLCAMGQRTLLVSAEMGSGAVLADRLAALEGPWGGLDVTDSTNAYQLAESATGYDWIVVDSMAMLTADPAWWVRSIQTSAILIFQVTKDGTFRGDQAWQHLCDLWVRCEKADDQYIRTVQKCWLAPAGSAA